MRKNDTFTYFNLLMFCMWPKVINKVKVTHEGKGHIKVKVKYLHPFKFYVAHTLCKRVVCIRLKCYLLHLKLIDAPSKNTLGKLFCILHLCQIPA